MKKCIIIGFPVNHSLSPKMHTAGYQALGIEGEFEFTKQEVEPEELESVIDDFRKSGVHGITVTIPHKVEIMKFLDEVDPIAKQIGAVNTVLNKNGKLIGYNTDWLGTINPLKEITDLKGKKVALIGAGGASRAMAYGLAKEGAELKIFNRTLDKAEELAQSLNSFLNSKFQIQSADLSNLEELKNYDIIVNSTSLGMGQNIDKTPVPAECLQPNQIVFDAVYVPRNTKLIQDAQAKGCQIIYGYQMLLHQGLAQFTIYTDKKAPKEAMEKVLI